MVQPEIFRYTNSRDYLRAWVAAQPEGAVNAAARGLARELGFSRQHAYALMSGSRSAQPDQVAGLSRFLGHIDEEREYLRRVVALECAPPEQLRELRLSMWEMHAAKTGIDPDYLRALDERRVVPGAAEGEVLLVLPLLRALGLSMSHRELEDLLVLPPEAGQVEAALRAEAAGASIGALRGLRCFELGPPSPPQTWQGAGWHGTLDVAREGLLRVPAEARDYSAYTASVDEKASRALLQANERLGRDLRAKAARAANRPVDQLTLVVHTHLLLSEVLAAPSGDRPPAGTSFVPLRWRGKTAMNAVEVAAPAPNLGDRPCIYLHLSFVPYLQAWIAWRRARREQHSQGWLAPRFGVSKSMVHKILRGTLVLQPGRGPEAARTLGLDEDEAAYLEGLLRMRVATDVEDQARERRALVEFAAKHGVRTAEGEAFRLTSHWAPFAIFALSFLPAFNPRPGWISKALYGRIPFQDVRQIYGWLAEAGMVAPPPGGPPRPTIWDRTTDATTAGIASFAHQDSLLQLLQFELQHPTGRLGMHGKVLALSGEDQRWLRDRITAHRAAIEAILNEAEARFSAGSAAPDRAVLLATQMLPLTRSLAPFFARQGPRL